MKKLLLVLFAFLLTVPASFSRGESPGLVVKPAYYTNKSPFLLEGFAQAGSEIEICGTGIALKVDDQGKFTVELKVEEGINLFAITATKDGTSTTKGFMVEMDSTPPEVTLLIDGKLTKEKMVKIELLDASQFEISGFAEPGCKVLADDVDYSTDSVKFEAKFKVDKAPSNSDHNLVIIDKFKNETKIKVNDVNNHEKVIKLIIENKSARIDGKEVQMGVPIKIINGSTMIPMRFMVQEILGGTAEYNARTKTVTIFVNDIEIKVQIAANKAIIDGKEVKITPPTVYNGSTMLPLRFFSETFGFKVDYDNETKTITLSKIISPIT